MARALRVKLDPIPEVSTEGSRGVAAVLLSLADLGKGSTKAEPTSVVDAKISFRLTLRQKVLRDDLVEQTDLGSLSGKLELRGGQVAPVFIVTPDAAENALVSSFDEEAAEQAPPPAEGVEPGSVAAAVRLKPRTLDLLFDKESFEGTSALPVPRLIVPGELLGGCHFLELAAELEVAGASEASFESNDVLDGRVTRESPPPLPLFDVLLLDDLDQPLDGVALRFETDGEPRVVTTDATGFARIVAEAADSVAEVLIDDFAALRARMKPLWDKADRGKGRAPTAPSEEIVVFAVRGDESPRAGVDAQTPVVIRVQPYVSLVRLKGPFFDLNKNFLLNTAIGGLRDVRSIYDANDPSTLLLVGHTDTSGQASRNDPLSLERARSVAAYLSDQVDVWEKQFESGVPEGQRWGRHEDEQMIEVLPDAATDRQPGEGLIAFFQRTRGFTASSSLGKAERQQLITEYMALDGADVKEAGLDITLVTHGAGENFPLDDTGEAVDNRPADGKRDALDRRVELFFFDKELGVQPVVADGSNSKPKSLEYREWRRRALELSEVLPPGGERDRIVSVILLSNSGNLPLADRDLTLQIEGEQPIKGRTDKDGFFEKSRVPAGDHLITIDGISTFVAATPTSIVRREHVVTGHALLDGDA